MSKGTSKNRAILARRKSSIGLSALPGWICLFLDPAKEKTQEPVVARKFVAILMGTILLTILALLTSVHGADKTTVSDDWIVATAKVLMEQDGRLDPMKIQVKSDNGMVVLSGAVLTDFERARAENIVTAVPGVKAVRNEIVVAATNDPDDKLAKRVRANLLENPLLRLLSLSVKIKNGVARVYGIAREPSQKRLVDRVFPVGMREKKMILGITSFVPTIWRAADVSCGKEGECAHPGGGGASI